MRPRPGVGGRVLTGCVERGGGPAVPGLGWEGFGLRSGEHRPARVLREEGGFVLPGWRHPVPGALGAAGRVGLILLGWGFPSPGWGVHPHPARVGGRVRGGQRRGSWLARQLWSSLGMPRASSRESNRDKGILSSGDTSSLRCGEALTTLRRS